MKTLVLNLDYQPIGLIPHTRAFTLVYQGKAVTISNYKDKKLHSAFAQFDIPSVIRIHKYVNIRYKSIQLTRHNVFKRDQYKCCYCGTVNPKKLTWDHVIPRAKGGKTKWDNLVTACEKCNTLKGDKSVEEVGVVMRYLPFRPSFIMFLSKFTKLEEDWKPYLYL